MKNSSHKPNQILLLIEAFLELQIYLLNATIGKKSYIDCIENAFELNSTMRKKASKSKKIGKCLMYCSFNHHQHRIENF